MSADLLVVMSRRGSVKKGRTQKQRAFHPKGLNGMTRRGKTEGGGADASHLLFLCWLMAVDPVNPTLSGRHIINSTCGMQTSTVRSSVVARKAGLSWPFWPWQGSSRRSRLLLARRLPRFRFKIQCGTRWDPIKSMYIPRYIPGTYLLP